MSKKDIAKAIFTELVESNFKDSKLKFVSKMFVNWCYNKGFNCESFEDFCNHNEKFGDGDFEADLYDTLAFISEEYTSLVNFAVDWLVKTEEREFLNYYYEKLNDDEKEELNYFFFY